ncbi:unnamed protein product [marine sediment metagenome]|uniref:Phospholipid/glycerol acyltransferase domain-containing protein n=1 Tax=marine sediment metagenome TaxID=412755 RepID=X0Z8J4_9ZZZZ
MRFLGLVQLLAVLLNTLVMASTAIVFSLLGWRRIAYYPVWAFARLLLLSTAVRHRVHGLDNVPGSGSYVVVSNHCSHLDGPTIALALPHPVYFIIKKELTQIPFFGRATVALGFIAVDRSNTSQARAEMARAAETIRQDRRILVFAEGTRSPDGHLQRFKKGGFHLAVDAKVPILPVTINGSHRLYPKNGHVVRPGVVDVIVGRPISTSGLCKKDVSELMEQTRDQILQARLPRHVKVLDDFLHRSCPELLVRVHRAKRAAVVRASDCGLDDERSSLARRTEDNSLVAHRVKRTTRFVSRQVAKKAVGCLQ